MAVFLSELKSDQGSSSSFVPPKGDSSFIDAMLDMWAPDGWRAQYKDIRDWMKTKPQKEQHEAKHCSTAPHNLKSLTNTFYGSSTRALFTALSASRGERLWAASRPSATLWTYSAHGRLITLAHGHINLLGWVEMAIFAALY